MMLYRVLADVTVVIHLAYASFIVLGLAAILLGIVRRWSWIRNFWFRMVHLLMIGMVAAETVCGIDCPLTVWENRLRTLAGETTYAGSFIGSWANALLFVEMPEWLLSTAYLLFLCLVLATFVAAPPGRPWQRRSTTDQRPPAATGPL